MKKSAIVFALPILMFFSHPLAAQQSIGFSDSTDFQYLIDYRLPDWGYSNFYLESGTFRTSGGYHTSDSDTNWEPGYQTENIEEKNSQIDFELTPSYRYYRESEQRTVSVNTNLTLNTEWYNSDSDVDRRNNYNGPFDTLDYEQNAESRAYGTRYHLNFTARQFITGDLFLLTSFNTNLDYRFQHSSSEHTNPNVSNIKSEDIFRRLNIYPQLGIGFGRLRNITPQLRAIRLHERYKSIGNGSLTNAEILSAAEHFTKLQGYQNTTDRYQKYFWGDMNQMVSGKLDAVEAYDLFYLRDVLNENLGQRLEGFEASLSGTFVYQNVLQRDEQTEDDETNIIRDIDINKTIRTTAQIQWYKNLSLNHQLSFVMANEVDFPLETKATTKWDLNSQTAFTWLWTLTDRYLLTTRLLNQFDKPEYKSRLSDNDYYRNQVYLSGDLSYYIENRVALTAGARLGWHRYDLNSTTRNQNSDSLNWRLNASIRYYFGRNLF